MEAVKFTKEDFKQNEDGELMPIDFKDENGKQFKAILLSSGQVAIITQGTGRDTEISMKEANGDKGKIISAMMSRVTTIDGENVSMYQLLELSMKDYLRLQATFSELNF